MKISLLSLGCKVNQAEMLTIEGTLRDRGHEMVELCDKPEICIINTCSVTSKSDYQSRQLIRRAHKTGARLFVTGCYAELNREKVAVMDGVENVISNDNKNHIINMINCNNKCRTLSYQFSRTRMAIKVQDGCDYACSYCIIWKARGRSRSVLLESVISEINNAVSQGSREIVLTGIHLGLYGLDLEPSRKLSDLVEEILIKTRVERLRLSSLEIREIDDKLIELLSERRVCKHLHVPLQSGDDGVLNLMNRDYDSKYFSRKLERVAGNLSNIAIGTDIIAGFPGESEDAFENTVSIVKRLPFVYIHVFPYSRRPGTAAARLTDRVGVEKRKERALVLRTISDNKKIGYMNRQVDRILDVVIEEKLAGGEYRGTSDNYLKVLLEQPLGAERLRGTIIPVRIVGTEKEALVGKPIYAS